MNNIGYFIYSHSEYDDIWDICFSRIEKHGMGFDNYYLFTDKVTCDIPEWITPVLYTDGPMFSEKLKECLGQVKEDYIIYTHDDNFLRGDVDVEEIENLKSILDSTELSFIHLLRSGVPVTRFKEHGNDFIELIQHKDESNLYYLQDESRQYVGQPTLWDREKFIFLLEENQATASIAQMRGEKTRDLESPETHEWMVENNVRGCFYWNHEEDEILPPKNVTYQSEIFPTMNAIRKGKWYITEHYFDLTTLFKEFNIDPYSQRGVL
jgi:hypothetical protein